MCSNIIRLQAFLTITMYILYLFIYKLILRFLECFPSPLASCFESWDMTKMIENYVNTVVSNSSMPLSATLHVYRSFDTYSLIDHY